MKILFTVAIYLLVPILISLLTCQVGIILYRNISNYITKIRLERERKIQERIANIRQSLISLTEHKWAVRSVNYLLDGLQQVKKLLRNKELNVEIILESLLDELGFRELGGYPLIVTPLYDHRGLVGVNINERPIKVIERLGLPLDTSIYLDDSNNWVLTPKNRQAPSFKTKIKVEHYINVRKKTYNNYRHAVISLSESLIEAMRESNIVNEQKKRD